MVGSKQSDLILVESNDTMMFNAFEEVKIKLDGFVETAIIDHSET